MIYLRNFILVIIVFCIAITIYARFIADVPVRELLGQGNPASEVPSSPGQGTADTAISLAPEEAPSAIQETPAGGLQVTGANKNPTTFDFEELQRTLGLVDQKQRMALLENEESFRNFVKKEAANKSIDAAAHANKIDQNEKNLLIARRGAENILREIYLKQLIASKIPQEFPTEEQIKAYYEKNRDKFVLEERFPVWQIFLPVNADNSQKDIEILKKQAEAIISDISKNRLDFATAAFRYSSHQESKFNGGFMGLVKPDDLKPEIQKALLSLSPDKVSSPVSTGDGLHILKRGPVIAKQELKLEDVREQIRKLLNRQIRNELRQAIFKQAATSYPVAIGDKIIEVWRQKMQAGDSQENAANE